MTKQEFFTIMKSYLTSDLSDSPYYYWHPLQRINPDIPVIVFAVKDPENIVKVINGEKVGSYVGVK